MKSYVSTINTVIICVTIIFCFEGFLLEISTSTNTRRNTMERLIDRVAGQIEKSFREYSRQQLIVVNSETMRNKRLIREYDQKVYHFVKDVDGAVSLEQAYQ